MSKKYYFEDLERQKKLKQILDEWLGTPYRHHSGAKGLGCDCIHFVFRVLEEAGILQWRKNLIPDYPRDWHLHNTRELLSEGLKERLNVEKVDLSDLIHGDIILSHYGKAASHAAIYCAGYVHPSIDDMGVWKINFNDRLQRRQMRFAYRVVSIKQFQGAKL